MDDFALPPLDCLLMGRKLNSGDVFLDQGMRRRFADEDKMPVDRPHGLAQGLAREQVVTEINRIEPCVLLTVGRQPSLRRGVLAVLLFRAILRCDEFWFERDDLAVPRSN